MATNNQVLCIEPRNYTIPCSLLKEMWVNIFLNINKADFYKDQTNLQLICYAFYVFLNDTNTWKLRCFQDFTILFKNPLDFKAKHLELFKAEKEKIATIRYRSHGCRYF
ncbi:MAG: hypothetical protein K940chlam8_00201 [Chlamydiae bacterium]|nr:hypothetical protein [Chlamydiota bacterium]